MLNSSKNLYEKKSCFNNSQHLKPRAQYFVRHTHQGCVHKQRQSEAVARALACSPPHKREREFERQDSALTLTLSSARNLKRWLKGQKPANFIFHFLLIKTALKRSVLYFFKHNWKIHEQKEILYKRRWKELFLLEKLISFAENFNDQTKFSTKGGFQFAH